MPPASRDCLTTKAQWPHILLTFFSLLGMYCANECLSKYAACLSKSNDEFLSSSLLLSSLSDFLPTTSASLIFDVT